MRTENGTARAKNNSCGSVPQTRHVVKGDQQMAHLVTSSLAMAPASGVPGLSHIVQLAMSLLVFYSYLIAEEIDPDGSMFTMQKSF